MGNNNSSQEKIPETSNVSKKNTAASQTISDNMYAKADELYGKIFEDDQTLEMYRDPSRGISMPYISDKNAYSSETIHDTMVSSENPRYIEIVVCKCNGNGSADISERNEKYAVHKSKPDHDCRGNCNCIQEIIEITGNKRKVYDNKKYKTCASEYNYSATSDDMFTPNQKKNNQNFSPTSASLSPTSTDEFFGAQNRNNMANKNLNQYNTMFGGADSETSPEEISDSDEEIEETSDTSEMSDTVSSSVNIGNKKKPVVNSNAELTDEDDDDDEDLEGLDDEEISEDGLALGGSDIESYGADYTDVDTNDLYDMYDKDFDDDVNKMQNKIFVSHTDSDNHYNDDDDDFTENVRAALKNVNERKN